MTVNSFSPDDDDGISACCPSPAVLEDIRRAIKNSHALSAADVRLAARMGLLGAAVERPVGLNDGVFYPPSRARANAATAAHPLRAAQLAQTVARQPRKLHAVAFLVDFSDNVGVRPVADFQRLLFDRDNPDSLANYYRDISCGMLDMTGEVIDWIRAPLPYWEYTAGMSGLGGMTTFLLIDVLTEYCKTDNLKRFDVDGVGYAEGVFLIHAGGGAESEPDATKRGNMIQSHKGVLRQYFAHQGVEVYAYSTEPEDGKLGVFAHEFGHVLGLPDLYDNSHRTSGVGTWCLMGHGTWAGGGDKPTRMSCWCLSRLGWIEPVEAESANYLLEPLTMNPKHCLRVWTDGQPGVRYFLLENRQATGRDSALPGSGLAVWRVNEYQDGNTNPNAYMVGLEQADGARELEQGKNLGNAGDVFPGPLGRTKFNALTQPSSHGHDGAPTGISLSRIAVIDGKVTVTVKR